MKLLGKLLSSISANTWEFLRSDKAILVWASLVGVLSGLVAVLLKNGVSLIRYGIFSAQTLSGYNFILGLGPLIGLLLTAWFVKKVLNGDHPGGGIPATLHALSTRRGSLKRTWLFAPIVTSIFSVGFGGSGGLEAPAVQAGAAIGSEIASQTKRNFYRRRLLIACAATASLSAMFKAPIAALIFAVEVIMIDLTAASLVPLIFASLASLLTAYFLIEGEDILAVTDLTPFAVSRLPFYIVLGLLAGLGSVIFTRFYIASSRFVARFKQPITRILIAGTIVGWAVASFPSLYGEGYEVINSLFMGFSHDLANELIPLEKAEGVALIGVLLIAWALKPILTGLTVGAGGVAGVFAPALFGGALLGYVFALSVNLIFGPDTIPVGNAVLVGLGGMMAGVLHAPLTAIFLASEISGGYELFVPLMLGAALSYLVSKVIVKNSIYTRELAERGELLTHDKDKSVLTLMSLTSEIETDFLPVSPDYTLGVLVRVISQSHRNLHPVVDDKGKFLGQIDLQDIRQIMFDRDRYENTLVKDLLVVPDNCIIENEKMESVMSKFEMSGAWNLPVISNKGKYIGYVSRSRLFNAYRSWLKETSSV
ncbi:MAG: chloride channel protein [Bacteroidetes bacterium]|nr:MAG: chloride channel protein [Bacteroidota bacterium]